MTRDHSRTYTGPAGQYRDAHGVVTYALRLPNWRQQRTRRGLRMDFAWFVNFNRRVSA